MHQLRIDAVGFEGRSNAYLIEGDGPTSLIDTGVATAETEQQLRSSLSQHGVEIRDIDRILLTHFHYDHAGLAGLIQQESGAEVYCHPDEEPYVTAGSNGIAGQFAKERKDLQRWEIPSSALEELLDFLQSTASLAGDPPAVNTIDDGDRLQLGSSTATACHLPGHTAGHLGFDLGDGAVVAGDAMLPVYTANVGGADLRLEHPLVSYFESLDRILALEPDVVWPGHRDPIDDAVGRANEISEHHCHRAGRILDVLRDVGPTTPWQVATELFGDLRGIHILHGTGETYAHLDYLRLHGHVTMDDGRFDVQDGGDLKSSFPHFE